MLANSMLCHPACAAATAATVHAPVLGQFLPSWTAAGGCEWKRNAKGGGNPTGEPIRTSGTKCSGVSLRNGHFYRMLYMGFPLAGETLFTWRLARFGPWLCAARCACAHPCAVYCACVGGVCHAPRICLVRRVRA